MSSFSTVGLWIHNVVAAVAAAHDLGIVHRDLKPGNVMLVKTGNETQRAVVTDFGLAVNLSTNGASDEAAGTPAYMAPEQAPGGAVCLATDQFALGLLVCKMLTGTLPELCCNSASESRSQLRAWFKIFLWSAMKTSPALSTATPVGFHSVALVAGPPSPENP
jgi:serine/threonine protein kinase